MEDQAAFEGPKVMITVRVEEPDGSLKEVTWSDSGRVTIVRTSPEAASPEWLSATLEPDGTVVVATHDRSGNVTGTTAPDDVQRSMNSYGLTVERSTFSHGLTVERCYDDNDRLSETSLRAPGGGQTLSLHTDGSRSLVWHTTALHGRQSWDANGNRQT